MMCEPQGLCVKVVLINSTNVSGRGHTLHNLPKVANSLVYQVTLGRKHL